MKHYIAVIVPQADKTWRVHIPDLPGCHAEAVSVEQAIWKSRQAAHRHLKKLLANGGAPSPRAFDAIVSDARWAKNRALDWRKAIISLIPLPLL